MLDAVLEHFPGQTIKAVFGGFHLIDLPLINSMAGNKDDVEELGKAILKYPIERVYTGHCTGIKAYRILKEVMGAKLEYYCTQNGNKLEIHTAADDSQSGICVFPDGSTCDEWAYYRGECGPAAQTNPMPAATVEEQASGGYMPPGTSEEIADWWGVIKGTEPGAQFDDYFERQDLGQIIYFGIDSMDPAVRSQIEVLRDSGKIVHLYGTLLSNLPDYNGSQIQVDRIEVEG